MSQQVHSWPVIVLTIGEGEIVADANGDVLTYPVLEEGSSGDVAADAAAETCRRLGLKACRVQGHTIDGEVFEMVVDADLGVLEERPADPVATTSRGGRGRSGSSVVGGRRRRPKGRKLLLFGSCAVLVGAVGFGAAYSALGWGEEPVAVVVTPPPAQLPVPAPAGWDTYGDWTAPMTGTTTQVFLDPSGQPVSVSESKLTGHDPRTGIEKWTRTAPFTVGQVALFEIDGEPRIGVASTQELVLFGDGPDPIRVNVPQDGTIVLDGGTAPRVDLPDKRSLLVAADGSTASRVVPAGAEPIEALGDDLVAANSGAGRVWRIASDSAALPSPATVPAPSSGAELVGVLGSLDGRVVAGWKDGDQVRVGFYDLGEKVDETELTQVALVDVEGMDLATGGIQIDRNNGLMLAGSVLIDVDGTDAHRLPGSGDLSAGYAWVTSDGEQLRINAAGETEDTTDSGQAAIPDVITDDGRAITRAGSSTAGTAYALAEVGPRPTPTPSPTDTNTGTPVPETAPSTTPSSTTDATPRSTASVSPKENS